MTNIELQRLLSGYPDDAVVHVAQPTHNHWNNVRALELDHVGQCDVVPSAYLGSKQIVEDGADREELDAKPEWVLILADSSCTVDV